MKYYLKGKQAQLIDKYTQEFLGIPGLLLMEKAAAKLADSIELLLTGTKILSVVESGNNGGDAVCAAWMLKERGYDTYIYEIGGISHKSDSYLAEIEKAKACGVGFIDSLNDVDEVDIILDGIFGVGLTRNVTGVQAEAVEWINNQEAIKVSVDIPSGISSDSGKVLGTAVRADYTVTFEYIKLGMLFREGREYSGRIICKSIGLYHPDTVGKLESAIKKVDDDSVDITHIEYEDEDLSYLLPKRTADSNKGSYGRVLIIAGSRDIYGAVYLAAEAAYRVGAGLVKVVTHIRNRDLLMDKLPEAMLLTYGEDSLEKGKLSDSFRTSFADAIGWANVILAGPGLGREEESYELMNDLRDKISGDKYLVLDADALNILSESGVKSWLDLVRSRIGSEHIMLTPHIKEMERLLTGISKETGKEYLSELSVSAIKEDRMRVASEFAHDTQTILVLKDARTVVAHSGGCSPIYINTTGNSGMSKGGSGDVLAGILAGLLAQMNDDETTSYVMSCLATFIHGTAGDIAAQNLGEYSMLARDIIDAVPSVLRGIE